MPETVRGFHYLRMVPSKKITLKSYVQHVHALAAKRSRPGARSILAGPVQPGDSQHPLGVRSIVAPGESGRFISMFLTALSSNRSPLYTSCVSFQKCRHQRKTVAIVDVFRA